ncbi:hypothetical protein BSKO_11354 [Bryopsis sp. KO-2023]|nr:hypothetical protein BSKO_11354 [Bryopsis sp. KO-2023]
MCNILGQIFGLQKREVDLCDELAGQGYIAVAVDTFDGKSSTWIPRAITFVYQKALTEEGDYGVPQVDAAVRWIRSQEWGQTARMAVAGFCYGGGCSIRYAVQHPDDLQAAVVFYGRPVNAEQARQLRCPVLGIYGTSDSQFPKETVDAFETALSTLLVDTKVERYLDQKHAFVTDLEAIKKGGPPAAAWNSFLDFLDVHMKP